MALQTPWSGDPYPELPDAPNGPVAFFNVASALDKLVIPKFGSKSDRDTAAALATLTDGMMCYRTDLHMLQTYNGTSWIDGSATSKSLVSDQTSNTSTLANSLLTLPVEASATYDLTTDIVYSMDQTAAGMQIQLTGPAGTTWRWTPQGLDKSVSGTIRGISDYGVRTAAAIVLGGDTDNTTLLWISPKGRIITSTTAGSITIQMSQAVTTAGSTHAAKLLSGSKMSLRRIA